ncbi:hypothetical protein [uncultured Psychroserpens sp.]|uniref:hypothetical protein n=1 Tax=uncultured Psychroserpens sp. TaxID=255436 RepID=UPI0026316976|nr:hypothetical protein [uncultured Psychroserpens sp.]
MKKSLLYMSILFVCAFAQAQNTYVPDDNFEQVLIDLNLDDVLDDYVLTANINTLVNLTILNKGVDDLTGIEDFTALEYLWCPQNNLTSLDLSANTALETLNCDFNDLNSLGLSSNTALEYLSCKNNNLSSLDLSSNTALERFYCNDNNLTSLDLSTHTALTQLFCKSNNLSVLNLANGNNTNIVGFSSTGNSNLTCIQVDNASYSITNWTSIDDVASFSEDCDTLSTNSFERPAFSIYPIPNNGGIITVDALEAVTYELINTRGQIIKQGHLTSGKKPTQLYEPISWTVCYDNT